MKKLVILFVVLFSCGHQSVLTVPSIQIPDGVDVHYYLEYDSTRIEYKPHELITPAEGNLITLRLILVLAIAYTWSQTDGDL